MGLSKELFCEAGSFSCCHLNPHRCFQSEVWGFISLHWSPGLCSLSGSPVVPPILPTCECGTGCSTSLCVAGSTSCRLACPYPQSAVLPQVLSAPLQVSTPPTSLDECFFLNSLVVRLPYSLIFHQLWLFLFLNCCCPPFWLCKEAQCVYLHLHLGQKFLVYTSEDIS